MLGSSIQEYELQRKLGKGGFGTVYQAQCKKNNMNVAIKVIDKKWLREPGMQERIVNEIKIHKGLKHPSILELYHCFQDERYVYLVMELCPQGELYEFVRRKRRKDSPSVGLEEEEARRIFQEIVEGVSYLHACGIIHRDLKLSNVLLTEHGNVKIADFGLAAKLDQMDGERRTVCGTPNYISPEVVAHRPYGLPADIWSLGCMLCTLLTGKPPVDAEKGIYELPSTISFEARDLIDRLLQKKAADRLTSSDILKHVFFKKHTILTHNDQENIAMMEMSRSINMKDSVPSVASIPLQAHNKYSFGCDQKVPVENKTMPMNGMQQTGKYSDINVLNNSSELKNDNAQVLQPINPGRLKPLRQKTKHGILEIMENGSLMLDFFGELYVILISGNGLEIRFYRRPEFGTFQLNSATLERTHSLITLPARYHKKYKYAGDFIDLVRSKTPKIIYYSTQAKCILMDNAPTPDFDMSFFDKTKLFYSLSRRSIQITLPSGENHVITATSGTKIHVKPTMLPLFRHFQECLKTCLNIEKTMNDNTLPKIVKSSDYNSISMGFNNTLQYTASTKQTHLSTISTNILPSNAYFARETDRPVGLIDKSLHSMASQKNHNLSALSDPKKFYFEHLTDGTLMNRSLVPVSLRDSYQPSLDLKYGVQNSGISHSGSMNVDYKMVFDLRKTCFLPEIGWCLKSSHGNLILLFIDGKQLHLVSQTNIVRSFNGQHIHQYAIDGMLPDDIRSRLNHVPYFLQALGLSQS